jgi:hypothetical protein
VLELLDSKNVEDLYKRYEYIIKIVKDGYVEIGSQKCKYSSCVSYIKMLLTEDESEVNKVIKDAIKAYNKEIDIIKRKTKDKLLKFVKTEKESECWLSEDDKKAIESELESRVSEEIKDKKDLKNLRNLIIFKFYEDLASRCEVSLSKLYYDDEIEDIGLLSKEYNYIILKKEDRSIDYIRNQHKNVSKKGEFTISLDKDLYDLPVDMLNAIPTVAPSLEDAIQHLEKDHAFLMVGDVFSYDFLQSCIALRNEDIMKLKHLVHPLEFEMYYSD